MITQHYVMSSLEGVVELSYILPGVKMVETGDVRVLIVEDNLYVINSLTRLMKHLGFEHVDISFPGEAKQKIRLGNYNFLITDLNMPGMSGYDLIAFAKKVCPGIGCMLITAELLEDVECPEEARPDEILLKPFTVEELKESLNRILVKFVSFKSGQN